MGNPLSGDFLHIPTFGPLGPFRRQAVVALRRFCEAEFLNLPLPGRPRPKHGPIHGTIFFGLIWPYLAIWPGPI